MSLIEKELSKNNTLRPRLEELERYRPAWRGTARVAKGGWYGSTKGQLRLGLRVPSADDQVRSGLGFRVAKSHVPARDMSLSAIRLGEGREPNLEDQVGVERYELAGELIAGYRAVSVVPVAFLHDGPEPVERFVARSRERPIVIGTLVVTEACRAPEIERGTYSILYREGDRSRVARFELRDHAGRPVASRPAAHSVRRFVDYADGDASVERRTDTTLAFEFGVPITPARRDEVLVFRFEIETARAW